MLIFIRLSRTEILIIFFINPHKTKQETETMHFTFKSRAVYCSFRRENGGFTKRVREGLYLRKILRLKMNVSAYT